MKLSLIGVLIKDRLSIDGYLFKENEYFKNIYCCSSTIETDRHIKPSKCRLIL